MINNKKLVKKICKKLRKVKKEDLDEAMRLIDLEMSNNLELGNIMTNPNKNQYLLCPKYIIALLKDIEAELLRVMWNTNQEEFDSPFDNTANSFKNDVFEVQAYNWNDDVHQEYNFRYKDIQISWYKYLGRDTTINQILDSSIIVNMYNNCIDSLIQYEKEHLKNL